MAEYCGDFGGFGGGLAVLAAVAAEREDSRK